MFHAIAIIHPDAKVRNLEVAKLLAARKINQFDIFKTEEGNPVTIADVRHLQKFLSRTALTQSGKAAIITGKDITLEGQQALLKILEEPPAHSLIILCATHKDLLLPTILSRVVVIQPKLTQENLGSQDSLTQWWNVLKTKSPGIRLEYSSGLAKENESLDAWICTQLSCLRKEVHQNYTHPGTKIAFSVLELVSLIYELLSARKYIAGNISTKLVLDRIFLSVPFVSEEKS
ncbi:MAG: hypothetical protein AAB874_02135 [Patescibacteria group bacterium]